MQRRKAGLPDWLRLSWTPPAPYSFPVFLGDPETPEGSHLKLLLEEASFPQHTSLSNVVRVPLPQLVEMGARPPVLACPPHTPSLASAPSLHPPPPTPQVFSFCSPYPEGCGQDLDCLLPLQKVSHTFHPTWGCVESLGVGATNTMSHVDGASWSRKSRQGSLSEPLQLESYSGLYFHTSAPHTAFPLHTSQIFDLSGS